jgi:hypothetical protein
MKSSSFNSKALLLVLLLIGAVLYDSFAPGFKIFPSPILFFLQGFLSLCTLVIAGSLLSQKIQVQVDGRYIRIEINYGKAKSYDAREKIY